MRINNIKIKNFKSIGPKETSLDFSENIIMLIGENNIGKSTILNAINFYFTSKQNHKIEVSNMHNFDKNIAVEVTIKFDDISELEKAESVIGNNLSDDDSWTLKKKYYIDESSKQKCDYILIKDGEEDVLTPALSKECDSFFSDKGGQTIFVPANTDITKITDGVKDTAFSKIFRLLISQPLTETQEYKNLLESLESYTKLFAGSDKHEKVKEIENLITDKIKRIIDVSGIIDTNIISQDSLFPTPQLLTDDGRSMPPVEPDKQGHGFQRALIFSLLELYAELKLPAEENGIKNILMIEEPEIYMHPQMQRKMADLLYKLSDSGKIQIICGTHSPIFIKLEEKQKTLARVFKDENDNLIIKQVESNLFSDDSEEKNKLRVIMDFNPYVNELFFAKKVVLLEGDTEFITIPKVFNILKTETSSFGIDSRDITLINCKSRDSIPTFQKVLNHFGIKYLVIHDLESEKFNEGTNKKILDLLESGEDQRKYFDPDFESAIEIENKGSAKWFKAIKKIDEMSKDEIKEKLGEYINFVYGV